MWCFLLMLFLLLLCFCYMWTFFMWFIHRPRFSTKFGGISIFFSSSDFLFKCSVYVCICIPADDYIDWWRNYFGLRTVKTSSAYGSLNFGCSYTHFWLSLSLFLSYSLDLSVCRVFSLIFFFEPFLSASITINIEYIEKKNGWFQSTKKGNCFILNAYSSWIMIHKCEKKNKSAQQKCVHYYGQIYINIYAYSIRICAYLQDANIL